ncbi:S41 family peptidase [Chitinophaga sp. RAB17]|uniref:S41 family peptidase n=1 Tax=Chitinophaga sp. RAB17 TaxID=3233049 RepID=UPI003F8DD24B
MKRIILSTLLLTFFIPAFSFSNKQNNAASDGTWEGVLKAGEITLTVYFDIQDTTGAIFIPSQGIFRHNMTQVIRDKDSVTLSFSDNVLRAQFAGKVSSDSIAGVWRQGSASIPMIIHRIPKTVITHANVDVFLGYCKTHSLHRESANWSAIRDSAYLIADKSTDLQQLAKAVQHIFKGVHDNHASWIYGGKFMTSGDTNDMSRISASLMQAVNQYAKELHVIALDNKTGYIRMPMINAIDPVAAAEAAQKIKEEITRVSTPQIQKWVLDLRVCGGGNMMPMLNGISGLLEDAPMGGFTDDKGQFMRFWGMRQSVFFQGDSAMNTPATITVGNKLAILTGPVTASAGEAVAVALEGRQDTRYFGSPSFGQITCTNVFPLGNLGMLVIAIGYYTDRNKKVYKVNVSPDEAIGGQENFENPKQDPVVIRAAAWLNK